MATNGSPQRNPRASFTLVRRDEAFIPRTGGDLRDNLAEHPGHVGMELRVPYPEPAFFRVKLI